MGACVLRFSATLEEYQRALVDLQAALDANGVRARSRYNAELVFEEIVCNIIRHGRAETGERVVELSLAFGAESIVMSFRDNGPEFDPRHHPTPDKPGSLEHTRVGGLGLLLVRTATTRMEYERTPKQENHLTVAIATRGPGN